MAVSRFDSELYRDLFYDAEIGDLFADEAELRAMLRVEAALAKTQGELGLIPAASASAIERALADSRLDASSLVARTGRDGIVVPAMLDALRDVVGEPEHAQYLHFGATSQDIIDSALMLRLRDACAIYRRRMVSLLHRLADLAESQACTPTTARTRMQNATPTGFGAQVACWGAPFLRHLAVLQHLEPRLLLVSLAGASGNSSALGERADALRAALAEELGLGNDDMPWHSERSSLAEFAALLTRICGSLAKMSEDLLLAAQSDLAEISLGRGGGSSAMPHKNNPVAAEAVIGLFRFAEGLNGVIQQALLHRGQRDGAAWMAEWLALPQICAACGRALEFGQRLLSDLRPDSAAMRANLDGGGGLVYAEAVCFRLAGSMPRAQAQARVAELCARVRRDGGSLTQLAAREFPQVDWTAIDDPEALLGDAPRQALAFAERVRATFEE